MKLYYKVMISSIYTAQNNGPISDIWKFTSSFYFAFATSIYIIFIFLIFNNFVISKKLDFLILNIININAYNFILNIIVYIILPIMALNYWLLLKGNKYKKLITQYKGYYNKKTFIIYFGIAFLTMFSCLFLKR